MAKKVQLMTNAKQWQVVDGVEVLVDVPQEDIDPITDSSCVEIEGHRTLEETISQENMFTPKIVETKVRSKVGGVYHDNVVDGAYEEAILYGNTQVNLVESITSGTKYIPHSFTSFQGNESKIGNYNSGRTNQVAPLIKGVTMVNLVQEGSMTLEGGTALIVHNVKGNTEYTLKFTFTQKNSMASIVVQSYKDENGTLTYLENSKLQSGLGDEVAITFTTHEQANRIHICNGNEYGGETIQLDNIMVIEGDVTDLNLPFFKGMRSVELSRPLTNLFTDDLKWGNQGTITYTNSSGNVTVTSEAIQTWAGITFYLGTLKQNTKYLVMWDSLTQTQTSTSSLSIIAVYDVSSNTNIGTANSKTECPTLRSIVFNTTGRDYTNIGLRVHATLTNSETGTTTVKGLRVFEWDDSLRTLDLQTIGYFSGTKYVSVRALETEGKNLYPYGDVSFTGTNTNVDSWYDHKGTGFMHGDIALKSKSRFLLKQGTYTITTGVWVNATACQLIDDKEQIIIKLDSGQRNHVFTLSQDTYYTLRIKASAVDTATQIPNIQIERGETATTYEAYNSRYYKPRETEEIILRSLPNGVCDTFNLQTGELVQNIGEIVLDGDENIKIVSSVSNDTHTYFDFDSGFVGALNDGDLICDSFTHIDGLYGSAQTVEGINIGNLYWGSIRILNSRLSSVDVAGFRTWLQENPVTVQYELKEPIITKLQTYNRVYSGQTNALVDMGNNLSALTYYSNNYYLKVGNLSPIPGIIEPITSIPYNVRLKPSTLYTVKYNRGGNSNSMSFDLGGSIVKKTNATDLGIIAEEFTVKTPTILSHKQIQLLGTGFAHNFIIVEGDITGTELPYFQGMKDVKMPIVKNISKNLLDESTMTITYQDNITLRYYKAFACKPNTTYHFKANKGETQCNWYSSTDPNAHIGMSIGMNNITYLRYTSTIKTPADCKYLVIYTGGEPSVDPHSVKTAVYEDGSSLSYESHKENSIYITQGEYPITSEMIEQGGFSTANGANTTYETMKYVSSIRLRSKNLIPVKPNTTYHIDATNMGGQLVYNIYQWNGNREFMESYSYTNNDYKIPFTFTTTADTQYIHMLCSKYGNGTITVGEYDWSQFHMYELDSTINLRSLPNRIKDELNLLTGEYIQRVGEVVFDGSDIYGKDGTIFAPTLAQNTRTSTTCVSFGHNSIKKRASNNDIGHLKCDKLNVTNVTNTYTNEIEGVSQGGNGQYIQICLNNDKLSSYDLVGVQVYLQSNPITVQYELAQPIISHVRLVSNNQEREVGVKLPNGVCNTYNPSTGITTVRVGKVVLDGSEDYELHKISAQTTVWYTSNPLPNVMNFSENTSVVAEGINAPYPPKPLENQTQEVCYISNTGKFNFTLLNTKASTVNELKTYLASNPMTVWYELKYPQIQPDIVLPNGVHDEYNPETGVYTKKVGFIEFDGSEDEVWAIKGVETENYKGFYVLLTNITPKPLPNSSIINNNFNTINDEIWLDLDREGSYIGGSAVAIIVAKSKLTTQDIDGLRLYLSQNPFKLWYELATPITYQLTPYFGLLQPYAYKDGYLIHDSAYPETTLPPEFKYKLVANRTGQVMQNSRKLQEHTTRLSNLEALIIEATIESLFNRELQLFELELMDIQLIDLGE